MISATGDASQVALGVAKLKARFESETPKALLDTGYEGMRLSQMEVPHDEGTLQNSGAVEPMDGDVVLGYHTPYAARLHEHPEYRFQKGRKGKYLDDPLKRNANVLNITFGESLQGRIF